MGENKELDLFAEPEIKKEEIKNIKPSEKKIDVEWLGTKETGYVIF